MVKFETIKSDEVKFGANNFLEIARKKAVTDDGENEFISVSRGFVDNTGARRYRKSISVPLVTEVIDFVSGKVKEMGEGAKSLEETKKEMTENDVEKQQEAPQEEAKPEGAEE
ncbi:hypothetical protein ACFLQN_00875 [Candidatus Aenigmatarchaeota archaeon]